MTLGKTNAEFPTKLSWVKKIRGWRLGLAQYWARLHTNQIIYIIALVLFFIVDGNLKNPNTLIGFVGVLAFFGMARELWAIFIKVWESTFGRLILLVLYAAIANFTLAVAAQKVNNEKNTPRSVRIDETSAKSDFLDNLIASFVYNYEAFEHSHCQKEPDERVVYISENDILVVKVDIGSTTEYAFSTRSCVVSN